MIDRLFEVAVRSGVIGPLPAAMLQAFFGPLCFLAGAYLFGLACLLYALLS